MTFLETKTHEEYAAEYRAAVLADAEQMKIGTHVGLRETYRAELGQMHKSFYALEDFPNGRETIGVIVAEHDDNTDLDTLSKLYLVAFEDAPATYQFWFRANKLRLAF